MHDNYIEELSKLKLKYKSIKRSLDLNFFDKKSRVVAFKQLSQTKKEIDAVNFKLRLLKELKK